MRSFAAAVAAFALTGSTSISFAVTSAGALAAPDGFTPPRTMASIVKYAQRSIAIVDVRLFDGTGAPVRDHQTVVIEGDRIAAVGATRDVHAPAGATIVDGRGATLMPGMVATHEHLFWFAPSAPGPSGRPMPFQFPRLYLAAGVTSARTTGSMSPWTDLATRDGVAKHVRPGPKLDVTSPYISGPDEFYPEMARLRDAAEGRAFVDMWADRGVTSFKLYMHVQPDVARAVAAQAHRRHAKVVAHLCSIGAEEAVAIGVDSLEHGLFVDEDFDPKYRPNVCPDQSSELSPALAKLPIGDPRVTRLVRDMIAHHVALSSTLPVFEAFDIMRYDRDDWKRTAPLLNAVERAAGEAKRDRMRRNGASFAAEMDGGLKTEMRFEVAFYRAGGLLTGGADPTGLGTTLAGIADQREFELLVEAGLRIPEAVRVMTLNGAVSLGRADSVGTIAAGKSADLLLLDGDLANDVTAIEHPRVVFQDGIGYDAPAIFASLMGSVGGG
ncbi:MAG TPA: amidohydrolase family protein [Xanthomonadales bacterium]|nr:amidohydrolase family protein [Xanthomonadales bacterium]